ncbi:MAG: DUF192 domain-containing protein [Candidatus Micrarchaeia archaeon]
MGKGKLLVTMIVFAIAIIAVIVYISYMHGIGYRNTYGAPAESPNGHFNTSPINISYEGNTLHGNVYIATSLQQLYRGYMNSTSIGNCSGEGDCIGMLFIFENQSEECFWMKNTIIPLRQLWISQNGIVTYAYNASPYSTKTVCAVGRYVLETQLDIPVGANVSLP